MLIFCERKILLNGWLILADKLKRIGPQSVMSYDVFDHIILQKLMRGNNSRQCKAKAS
jgi:hypothetical protein